MLKIYLDCHQQYINIIKRHINTYYQDVKYVTQDDLTNAIYLKEIRSILDIDTLNKNNDYVFLINSGDHMFELLEYAPLTFIRTTYLEKDIERFIHLLQYRSKGIGVMLDFKSGYQQIRINAENIEYIESLGHYLLIHSENATFKVREKLSELLDRIKELGFIQVHKSYIININHIKSKDTYEIILDSNTHIPIGKKYKTITKKL